MRDRWDEGSLLRYIQQRLAESGEHLSREEIEERYCVKPLLIQKHEHPYWELNEFVEEFNNCDALFWNTDTAYEDHKHFIMNDDLIEWLNGTFVLRNKCPICSGDLDYFHHTFTCSRGDYLFERYNLSTCRSCTYWQISHQPITRYDVPFGTDPKFLMKKNGLVVPTFTYEVIFGKLRTFEQRIPDGCYVEIARHLRRDAMLWHQLEPTALEKLIASVFRANHKHALVTHVGRPDDGGVDVVFVDDGLKQWLIQVKRRSQPNATEGVSPVRNLLGAMLLNRSCYGMLVSTVNQFSLRAHEAVQRAHEVGMRVRLLDKGKLDVMLDPIIDDAWVKVLRRTGERGSRAAQCFKRSVNELRKYRSLGILGEQVERQMRGKRS